MLSLYYRWVLFLGTISILSLVLSQGTVSACYHLVLSLVSIRIYIFFNISQCCLCTISDHYHWVLVLRIITGSITKLRPVWRKLRVISRMRRRCSLNWPASSSRWVTFPICGVVFFFFIIFFFLALSVYSDSSPHFGGVQSFCSRTERYIW